MTRHKNQLRAEFNQLIIRVISSAWLCSSLAFSTKHAIRPRFAPRCDVWVEKMCVQKPVQVVACLLLAWSGTWRWLLHMQMAQSRNWMCTGLMAYMFQFSLGLVARRHMQSGKARIIVINSLFYIFWRVRECSRRHQTTPALGTRKPFRSICLSPQPISCAVACHGAWSPIFTMIYSGVLLPLCSILMFYTFAFSPIFSLFVLVTVFIIYVCSPSAYRTAITAAAAAACSQPQRRQAHTLSCVWICLW